MIGHLWGDFYLQSNKLAEDKKSADRKTSLTALGIHSLVYLVAMYVIMAITTGSLTLSFLPVLIIGVTHGIIDCLKIRIEKKDTRLEKYEWISFAVDQLIHISILYVVDCIWDMHADFTWLPDQIEYFIMQYENILTILIAVLICGKPAAIVVSLVFKMIPNTMEKAAKNTCTQKGTPLSEQDLQEEHQAKEEVQIGSWIGILEREIMLLLALIGQYGAIGFVLTAKSLARFKQLENKAFAEKYLLGTLLSSLIALLCVGMCMII